MLSAFVVAIGHSLPQGALVVGVAWLMMLVIACERLAAVIWAVCIFTVGLYLATPFIWMYAPDYFYGDNFVRVFIGFGLVSVALLTLRFAMIPVLWPRIYRYIIEGTPTLEDIAPEKGQTIAELKAGVERKEINFLFGTADAELVKKWGLIAEGIAAVSKSRRRLITSIVGFLVIWPIAVFILSGGMDGSLERDRDRMWQTCPFRDGMVVSTPAAMNAAMRVFKESRALRGLTRAEALEWLGIERKNPAFKLGKPRYDFEKDETLLVLSDGRESLRLVAVYNDEGLITNSWPEWYYTIMSRDLEKPEDGEK